MSAPVDRGAFEPRVLGLLCTHCAYACADNAGATRASVPAGLRTVRLMCTGRVEPSLVLEAFVAGADGVLIMGCHPGGCHYKEQNYRAVQRQRILLRLLDQCGVEPARCRFDHVSAAESARYLELVDDFVAALRRLGPLRLERRTRAHRPH
ncbi:MAG: hydrogenase iron-sulfur subunit [Myxococcales bacterium]|nr:hydrogenase iron-sulfur subunit [Myxococcales bacterium]